MQPVVGPDPGGLLHPDEVIGPYEKTLNAMPVAERRAWSHGVLASMDSLLVGIDTVVFFAGEGLRVVRVGTHGLKTPSHSTLWGRLSQHRGTSRGSGNHRGSIFRLLLGIALVRREDIGLPPSWGVGGDPGVAARRLGLGRADVKSAEADLEARVSRYLGDMPFLWLGVGDEPGPASQRGLIERNAIALLSSYREPSPDPPSVDWLGRFSDRERVRRSGLWNNNHVDEDYDPSFLDILE